MTAGPLDPRVHPVRADLAAAHLRDRVLAPRYAEGVRRVCAVGAADVHEAPDPAARRSSQLLFGEEADVFDEAGGWAWVQAAADGYVGYVRSSALAMPGPAPSHRVSAIRTLRFAAPDIKSPVLDVLPGGALLRATEQDDGKWLRLDRGGFVFAKHCRPAEDIEADHVAVAERLVGTPYLWGGRSSLGVDCSGLVQLSMRATGRACPRDSDMQRDGLGALAAQGPAVAYRRGDVVFFPAHVGMMADEERLLHATAFTLDVTVEPLEHVVARGNPILAVRRVGD